MEVVGEEDGLGLVGRDIVQRHMIGVVGRYEAVLDTVENGGLQPLPVGYGSLAILYLIVGEILKSDVESEFAHRGHIGAELH